MRHSIINTPASQAGRNGALLHMAVSSFPRDLIRGEVVRMWEKKLLQLLRVLGIAAAVMALLTTKAC